MDTTSIANKPSIDINKITSEGFDFRSYLSDDNNKRIDLLQKDNLTVPLATEMEDKYGMAAFVQNITTNMVSNVNANAEMLTALSGEKDHGGTWQNIKNSWRNGRNQLDRAEIRWDEMMGLRSVNYDLPSVTQMPIGADNWFESSLNAASNMLPMMWDTSLSAAKYGAGVGVAAAGTAAVAGQLGPQVGALEEVVTVPGAFVAWGTMGAVYGGVKRAMELEGGLMFDELLNMKGPNGERIDPEVAKAIAAGVGLVNGILEMAQIDELIKTIPGGKKILRKGITKSIGKVLKNRSLIKVAGKHLWSYGKTVTTETLQELGQESSNIVGGELAKYLRNRADDGDISRASVDEIMNRYADTAKQSIQAFSVIAAPGHIGGTVLSVVDEQGVKVKERVAPDVQITRVTDIRPRVDPKTLAEPLAPQPSEAITESAEQKVGSLDTEIAKIRDAGKVIPKDLLAERETARKQLLKEGPSFAKVKTEKVGFVAPTPTAVVSEEVAALTPEEQAEIAEIEKGAEAELPSTVNPKLYIGNVTQRMKKKFAEIWGTKPTEIKPFLEGPFPTKRTKIEMTGDQALSTLVMLEASLDQRLNDNLINTENDLAKANADWGDIKELRKVLGLPKTIRPFTVHRAKFGILTPEQVTGKIGFGPEFSAEQTHEGFGSIHNRIKFSVEKAKADTIKISRIDQLNNVMRQMRKAASAGHKAATKAFRELQYLRKQAQLRKQIVNKIKAEPSKGLDPFYAKAIKEIQSAIDFKAAGKKADAKTGLRKHLEDNPEKVNELPEELVDALDKRDVESLSMAQLQQIADEIKRLSKLGKLKSKLMAKQRKAMLNELIGRANLSLLAARAPKLHDPTRAWTRRTLRLLDMLDGGQSFEGPIVQMFDTAIQDATELELINVDHRQQRATAKLKELGLSLFHFARRRKVGDFTFTIDDMCGIYAGWMNEQSRLALQHGGIKMEGGKTLLITEEIHDQVVEKLTEEEKKWAEFIIEEYADNWERIRNAVIEAENRDLGQVTNYTKMRRIGVDKTGKDDILAGFDYAEESNHRAGIVQVNKQFTIDRKNIPAEYQVPIDTSLTKVWQGEIRKQEHYIAMAKLLKDLNAVVKDKVFADNVKGKFGDSVYSSLRSYLKRVADPDYYRTFDDFEKLSRTLRKNTAVAFLAYNLLTVAKQAPSLAFYAINSSFSDLLMSAVQVAVSPKKTYEAILSHNRQIGHAAIVREMEELKHVNRAAHNFIIRRIGNAGLRGIYEVDRVVRVIGENAVINFQMRKGLSLTEASKKARQTSIRTQPAAAAKDIAQLYANNEALNWFTMFTNQLNQIYNIATYDIPAAWQNRQFAEVGRSVIALSVVAGWIWALQHKELPDDRDDILDALTEQSLAAVPILGSAALAGKRGWGTPTPAPIASAVRTSKALFSLDMDKIMPALFEDAAILTGSPFIGMKRIYKTVEEKDLWELVGGKK